MRTSPQDRTYLETEADSFFERNQRGADPTRLRPYKQRIVERLERARVGPEAMLEYGCNYGDLLAHYAREHGTRAVGVEPSARAVEFGRRAYGDSVDLRVGTMAANSVNDDPELTAAFDLVVVDDVFCWVSRETLFQSVANVDNALREGGFLYIREFWPLHQTRNVNHHVPGGQVFCHKPRGPHLTMFTASGAYEIVWQEVEVDGEDPYVRSRGGSMFESRWSTAILRKSAGDYFE